MIAKTEYEKTMSIHSSQGSTLLTTIQRDAFQAQLDRDDDGGNFTASDERFESLVILSAAYNEEAARPGKRALERGKFAEKMARETNPGTLLLIFNFYAKLFAPHQQMQAKVPTYSEIMFANNTLSQGEVMCFCSDFRIVPNLLTRNDVRNIWPFIGEELDADTVRVGKELSLQGFQELLVRVALLNGMTPDGRPKALCHDKQAHSAIAALVKWLHLDDRSAVKKKLDTVGKKTQQRLGSNSHEAPLSNPFKESDARRFKLLDSLHPTKVTITEMLTEANRKIKAVKKRGRRNANTNVTQGLVVLTSIMRKYHHSLKHTFASFESELITTSWLRFNRDRASGQISRTYIDAGDCIENHSYIFTLRIKNQTPHTLTITGLEFQSNTEEQAHTLSSSINGEGEPKQNHPVEIFIDTTHKHQEDNKSKLMLHPQAIRRVNVVVKAKIII